MRVVGRRMRQKRLERSIQDPDRRNPDRPDPDRPDPDRPDPDGPDPDGPVQRPVQTDQSRQTSPDPPDGADRMKIERRLHWNAISFKKMSATLGEDQFFLRPSPCVALKICIFATPQKK